MAEEASSSGSKKQCTIYPVTTTRSGFKIKQADADNLIIHYIVNDMRPLSTVDSDAFRALVTGLCPSANVMCRKTLADRTSTQYEYMQENLRKEFNGVLYLCTTADIWSSSNRSFIGITAHWFSNTVTV